MQFVLELLNVCSEDTLKVGTGWRLKRPAIEPQLIEPRASSHGPPCSVTT